MKVNHKYDPLNKGKPQNWPSHLKITSFHYTNSRLKMSNSNSHYINIMESQCTYNLNLSQNKNEKNQASLNISTR